MYNLSLPSPLARLLRRLFNVFTSVTISNRYFLLYRTENETAQERSCYNSLTGASSTLLQALSTQASRAAFFIRKQDGTLGILRRLKFRELANENVPQDVPLLRQDRPSIWDMLSWSLHVAAPCTMGCMYFQYVPLEDDHNKKAMPLLPAPSTIPARLPQHLSLDQRNLPSSPVQKPPLVEAEVRPSDSIASINTLMLNPALFDPVRKPRNPIVLCHGLYGYDVWGPSSFPKFQFHYWADVLKVLKERIGADVIVTGVPSTGSIEERASKLDKFLNQKAKGQSVNFVAHSMGGLDCRYLITHVKPKAYCPSSLLTICTPHRGSPFMDWCKSNLGLGRLQQQAEREKGAADPDSSPIATLSLANLPSSFTTLLLSILDSPAYACLTTHYLEHVFNPTTPDDPHVRYYSVAARISGMNIWHPLFLPKTVLDGAEQRMRVAELETSGKVSSEDFWGNDGLVTVRSARWGEFLGTLEDVDHWSVRGASGLGGNDNGEWLVDMSAVRNSLSDPFAHVGANWPDWGRLALWWRTEHRKNSYSERMRLEEERARSVLAAEELREQEAVLRSSTEKISAVFDWIAEQVPYARSSPVSSSEASTSLSLSSSSSPSDTSTALQEKSKSNGRSGNSKDKNHLSRTFDLERFYTVLSRKLYDDGL